MAINNNSQMDQRLIDLIIQQLKESHKEKKIESLSVNYSEEYKLSWIYHLRSNNNENIIAKIYKKPRFHGLDIIHAAKKEYDNLTLLACLFANQENFKIPRPLGVFDQENAILLEEIKGKKASEIIVKDLRVFVNKQKLARVEEIFFRIGGWLRFFQIKTEQVKEEFNKEIMRKGIDKKLADCQELNLSSDLVGLVIKCRDKLFKEIDALTLTKVLWHGDFTPWNIFTDSNSVTVLDFAEITPGFTFNDLTTFLVALQIYKNYPSFSKSSIDKLTRAFLKGYGKEENSTLFAFFMLHSILDVLSWAKEIEPKHAWHRFQKNSQIRFYKNMLNNYCLDIIKNEPRIFPQA